MTIGPDIQGVNENWMRWYQLYEREAHICSLLNNGRPARHVLGSYLSICLAVLSSTPVVA